MPIIPFDHLTPEERLTLIEELIESLDEEVRPLPPGHREELERRLKTLDADIAAGTSWEEVSQSLRQRYG